MGDISAVFIGVFSLLPFLVRRFTGQFIYFAIFSMLAILAHGIYFYEPNIVYLLGMTYIISTVAELVSLKTPFNCFGVSYRYDIHNPFFSSNVRFLDVYPIEVSLAWVIFKYLSLNLAMIIGAAFSLPFWFELFFIPFILLSIDFIIDPTAVRIAKLWQWKRGSAFFGIPWQNFLGWYLVGLATTSVLLWFGPARPLTFHYLLVLPILFYGSLLKNVPRLTVLDKRMGIMAAAPVALWTVLSMISLSLLYLRQ